MHRRHEDRNIPTELLRTLVVIVDSGSFTKAAKALGLTQPAISSHIKRLQQIVAGEIFSRSSSGPRLTPYGEIIVDYARRSMAINDQILSLVNAHPTRRGRFLRKTISQTARQRRGLPAFLPQVSVR